MHECREVDLKPLRVLEEYHSPSRHESLVVSVCEKCGQLWKIRWQFDGTGSDDIWLRPGEKYGGYEFSEEEAAEYRELVGI